MIKKIVVIDVSKHLYPIILRMKDIEIVFLYIPTKEERRNIISKYPDMNIYCSSEPAEWKETFVSQEDIIKYRSTQLKVERFAQRFGVTPSYAMSQYYHSLAFWIYHLNRDKIDCVLIGGHTEHGSLVDSIPMDVAKSLKIPVFLFDVLFATSSEIFKAIKCYNTGKYINLKQLDETAKLVDFNNVIYPRERCEDKHVFDILDNIKYNVIKKMIIISIDAHVRISQMLDKLTGNKTCVLKTQRKDIDTIAKVYIIASSLWTSFSHRKIDHFSSAMAIEDQNSHLLHNIKYLTSLKKYYHQNSKKSIPNNQHCIVYALHLEPEASIMNRTIYDSQIYIIEMLASTLPEGWKLYVKEHPHQFKVFEHHSMYFFKQIPLYRDINYYNQLLKIDNVELLDDRISSSSLIDNIQYPNVYALATINGTIAAECMYAGKSVLLFDVGSTIYENIPGLFKISNIGDLKLAIDKLSSSKYTPDYGDFKNIISEYLIWETADESSNEELKITQNTLFNLINNANHYLSIKHI